MAVDGFRFAFTFNERQRFIFNFAIDYTLYLRKRVAHYQK